MHAAAAPAAAPVQGVDGPDVMRNVLSLAYMPRARACYLTRTGATAALRDLTGRVRLAIDLVRGEVDDARRRIVDAGTAPRSRPACARARSRSRSRAPYATTRR